MKALLIFILIIFGIGYLFRILAPLILRALIRYLNKKAEQSMKEQSRYYREHVDNNNPYEETTWFGEKIKVKSPRGGNKKDKKKSKSDIPDVDYEDVD